MEDVKADIETLFNSFQSIDNCLKYCEKISRDVRRAKSRLSATSEIWAEWGIAFDEASIGACYLDSYLTQELATGAKEMRDATHKQAVTKLKTDLKAAEEA